MPTVECVVDGPGTRWKPLKMASGGAGHTGGRGDKDVSLIIWALQLNSHLQPHGIRWEVLNLAEFAVGNQGN